MARAPRWLPRGNPLAIAIAAVLVLAAGAISAVTWASGPGQQPLTGPTANIVPAPSAPGQSARPSPVASQGPGQQYPGQLTAGTGWTASVPSSALPAGQRAATLVIVSGVPSVSVRTAAMPGTLVRAATSASYGATPVLGVVRGPGPGPRTTVGLSLQPAAPAGGASAGASLTVTVSAGIAWQLDFGGNTSTTAVDMRGGQVSGLAFGQGSAGITVALPRPDGTVTLRLEGGASTLAVSEPAGVPARVTAGNGASEVTIAGAVHTGIAGGTVITQPGWGSAASRVDIDATSGVSAVTVAEG